VRGVIEGYDAGESSRRARVYALNSTGSAGKVNILRMSPNQYLTASCSTGARSVPA
jgi:hypothetical protein